MKIANKKAIFFDLDHTLWDFEKNSALTFETVLTRQKVNVSIPDFIEAYVPINLKYWKQYRDGNITQQELRHGRLSEAFMAIGYNADKVTINAIWEDYIEILPQYNHLFEGAMEVLQYLRPKYSLHIITNGVQETAKLKNCDILHYFDTVTNSEMAGCKKPDYRIFEYALKAAKVQKKHSIMIGDCIEADVNGALNWGLDAIYFNENRLEASQDIAQIHHLLELKNIL